MAVVEYEKKGRIAYIMLNRPERLNAINPEVMDGLKKIWLDFKEDNDVWVAILYGAGKAFCSGGDLRDGRLARSAHSGPPGGLMGYESSPIAYHVWKPVIGALHGYVIGAGLWLALGCDLRIAASGTKLVFPEPRRGMATVFAAHMSNILPMAMAAELLLIGEPVNARRAYEGGMVNKVVPAGKLMVEATAWAEAICKNAPLAVKGTKEMLHRGVGLSYDAQVALGDSIFERVRSSEDFAEGNKAYIDKKKLAWKGR